MEMITTATVGVNFKTKKANTYTFYQKGAFIVKKSQNGELYETPTLDVVLIDRADVITTSPVSKDDYDQNAWT